MLAQKFLEINKFNIDNFLTNLGILHPECCIGSFKVHQKADLRIGVRQIVHAR